MVSVWIGDTASDQGAAAGYVIRDGGGSAAILAVGVGGQERCTDALPAHPVAAAGRGGTGIGRANAGGALTVDGAVDAPT